MKILTKQDENLYTGKTYRHNFQGYIFEEENCIFYVWHKKEIKLIESKNLGSTMNVFFIKDSKLDIKELDSNIKNGILKSCQIFSAFDEDNGRFYNFLPYFPTKSLEEKNNIFSKLGLNINLSNSSKGILINSSKVGTEDLDVLGQLGFLFGLTLLYGKYENKGDKLSSIKIQLPLFGQFLTIGEDIRDIQRKLQNNGIFIQISENIQGDKHMYEITSNDYELLEIFANLYLPVEKFEQITKREQAQEATEALKAFISNEGEKELIDIISNSCVKILQKI